MPTPLRRALGIISCLVAAAPAIGGCRGRDRAPAPAPAPTSSPDADATAPTEAEARALIDAWLAAQNAGDLAAYQKLYAARFDGIKRVGNRTRRFARAGWLADRARMFAPPAQGAAMSVSADALAVEVGPSTARVRLVQSFARGAFKDRGPKELLLAREAGALRIAREEMLASETETEAAQAPTPELAAAERGFFFVIAEGVVLSRTADRAAARGPLALLPKADEVVLVSSAVDERRLDESVRRWKGQRLQLYDETGPTCVATVEQLSLLVRVDPHFSTTQLWEGLVDKRGNPIEHGKPVSTARMTKEAWLMAEPILVGSLARGDCPKDREASWARDPALPAPAMATVTETVDAALRAEIDRQLARDSTIADTRKEAREGADEPRVSTYKVSGKGTALAIARFESGSGCADFVGLTFIWEIAGSAAHPRLRLLDAPGDLGPVTPAAAFDLDGDGRFEILGDLGGIGMGATLLLHPARGYGESDALSITSLDCYC